MKLHHFAEVVAIAERGSIRAAARHLNLAQPALTRSLATLERELGAPLFRRHARGVVPTPIGEAVARRGALILQEVRRARDEAEQMRGAGSGTVAVGLSMAAHIALLPPVLRRFRAAYPEVGLHVVEGFYPTLEGGLRDGALDFCVGPDPGAPLPAGMSGEVLAPGRRVVLARRGHPLAGARSLRGLGGAEWITTSITADAGAEFDAVFARHGLPPPRRALRAQSALSVMTCLASSDLLAMVPRVWADFPVTRGALAPIEVAEELAAPDIVLIRRGDLPLTPAATHLADLMRRAAPAALA